MRPERMVVLFAANGHPRGHRRCLGRPSDSAWDSSSLAFGVRWMYLSKSRRTSPVNPSPSRPTSDGCTHILAEYPGCRLWFTDGTNADGKVVANPNIGYGAYTITYADGSSRGFIALA